MAPPRGTDTFKGEVDGVSYTYYPKHKSGLISLPHSNGSASSARLVNFRVKAEFGGDVQAAVRAQLAVLKYRAVVEEAPHPASSTAALPIAEDDAERPRRLQTERDPFDPGKGWSARQRDQIGRRHQAHTPRDTSKADLEEQLNALRASFGKYEEGLHAHIDRHFPSTGPDALLHASGEVREDPLDVQGIRHAVTGERTHTLCGIRRISYAV